MQESNRIEFKRQLTPSLEREVVAFLNYREGGAIYIGFDDNGEAIDVADPDLVQLQVKDRLKIILSPQL